MMEMVKEVATTQITQNWRSYLLSHADSIANTLNEIVWPANESVSLIIEIDPKDLQCKKIGFMIGDVQTSVFFAERRWLIEIPVDESTTIESLEEIDVIIESLVRTMYPCEACEVKNNKSKRRKP